MQRVRKALPDRRHLGPVEKGLLHRSRDVHRLRRVRRDLPRRRDHEQSRRDNPRAQARRAPGRRGPSRQLQRMRRVRRRLPVRLHLAVAGKHGGLSRQGAGQRKDLRRMPALRRGLRMGRNLHHAVRPEGGVPTVRSATTPRKAPPSDIARACRERIFRAGSEAGSFFLFSIYADSAFFSIYACRACDCSGAGYFPDSAGGRFVAGA